MASSNRHWPSMFKSKHCNAHHLQWQHDVNPSGLLSGSCHRTDERAPEPKPRWNPKPEQIRILEAIFNSGMVNPPRDEIRRIRAQLQEYGQVGDANVFYWFQNRKSRSKHKLRHLQPQRQQQRSSSVTEAPIPVPGSSSSSSSDKSGNSKATAGTVGSPNAATATTGQGTSELVAYLSSLMEAGGGQWGQMGSSEGYKSATAWEGKVELESSTVYNNGGGGGASEGLAVVTAATSTAAAAATANANSTIGGTQGDQEGVVGGGGDDVTGSTRSLLIFINDVAFEIGAEHLNVRAAFGETAMLLHSSGQPVLVNQWGVTLQPLEHGASYYLV